MLSLGVFKPFSCFQVFLRVWGSNGVKWGSSMGVLRWCRPCRAELGIFWVNSHHSWKVTANKILREFFYCPTSFSDLYKEVVSYHECHIFYGKWKLMSLHLNPISVEAPPLCNKSYDVHWPHNELLPSHNRRWSVNPKNPSLGSTWPTPPKDTHSRPS